MDNQVKIDFILYKLKELWIKNPHLRLCQLIHNLTYNVRTDIFYLEDDKFLKLIEDELWYLGNKNG